MANARNILAGMGAGGPAGLSLAFFAPAGTAGPVATAGTAGVQTVTVTGTPTGGAFTLTWNGFTTTPIPYNATAAQVDTALAALPGGNAATTSGGPLPATAVVVTFPSTMPQVLMVANGAGLTGGTTPTAVVANTTPGVQSASEATAVIPAAYLDSGWCDQKGLTIKTNVSSNDTKGYGTTQVLRTIISDQKKTADLTFLETNPVAVAVYNALPLNAVTVAGDGSFKVATGLPQTTQYAAIFDAVDGANHMRYFAPYVQNITPGDLNVSMGQSVDRPISLNLYPDNLGNVLYEYYLVDALKS